jgi:pimeloyl-ACP methyl ester carboxylesterase
MEAPRRIDSTDGVRIVAHDLGGSGPTILMAHATGLHGHVWGPVARRLSPHFHCWALDLRGHGDAEAPSGLDYSWNGFAEDVLAAVDALGLDRPFGVGHSKGGAALLLAEEARPGTFAALWAFDPVVFPSGGAIAASRGRANPMAEMAEKRRSSFASRQEAFDNYRSKPPFAVVTDEVLHAYVDHGFVELGDGSIELKCRPEVEAQVYRMGGTHDAFDRLPSVTCPVTIARGRVELGPSEIAAAVADALPHGRLSDHPHLGHFGPLEAPDEIASGIQASFARG